MFFRNFLLCYLLVFQLSVSGQTVRGLIVEESNARPVVDVVVSGSFRNRQTISNRNGEFQVTFPSGGNKKLLFTHIGFEDCVVDAGKTPDSVLVVKLKEKNNRLSDAEIVAPIRRQTLTKSYSQSTIDDIAIEEKMATSLIDVLEDVPGITKRSEYHSPIVLRGLGGKRLLITQDGNRRMGNFSGSFMGQGVNVYDLAKVEVIKGPASVQYGPGAITGIINMVSKSPFNTSGWHGKAGSSYSANNNERSATVAMNYADMDNALSISGRWRKADDYTCGLGVASQNTAYEDKDMRVAYTHEGDNYVSWQAVSEIHLGGPWGRPVGFNGSTNMRVYNPKDDNWHNALTLKWQPETVWKQLEASVYFDKEFRRQNRDSYDIGTGGLSYRESVSYQNYYCGWRANSTFAFRVPIQLNIGTDGVFYRINSPTEYTDYFLKTTLKNRVAQQAGNLLAGIFAEGEYTTKNERLKIRAGLRADYSHINEGDVHDTLQTSGRTGDILAWNATSGVVYQFMPNVFASFQVARSCRMPDANEMFIVTSTSDGIVYGNPALQPERGLNFDAGLRGSSRCCSFDLSLFANFLKDFISQEYWNNSGKKGVSYTYYNIDKARIAGVELSTGTKWKGFLHRDNTLIWNNSCVFTLGDKLTGTTHWLQSGVPLRNIPPLNFNEELMLRRMWSSVWSFYVSGDVRLYCTQNRIAPSADGGYVSPGYCLFGASAGFTYKGRGIDVECKLRGDNLADNKYRPFESLVYAMGRNVKAGVTVRW